MGDPTLLKLLPPCASSPPQPVYSCPPTPPQRRQNLSARLWVDAWIRWPCVFPLKIKIESNNRKMPNTPPAPHKGRGRLRCLGIQAWQLAPKKPAPSLPVSVRIWLRLSSEGPVPILSPPFPGKNAQTQPQHSAPAPVAELPWHLRPGAPGWTKTPVSRSDKKMENPVFALESFYI